jgi:hypothetical protein
MTVEFHCGVSYLGHLNGSDSAASDPASAQTDWMPEESSGSSSPLRVQVVSWCTSSSEMHQIPPKP